MSEEVQGVQCSHCMKCFSSKQNLNVHLKTARFCLKKRGLEPDEMECILCCKTFASRRVLLQHLSSCVNKTDMSHFIDLKTRMDAKDDYITEIQQQMEQRLQEKDRRIAELEQKLDEQNSRLWKLAEQPRTVSKSTTNTTNTFNQTNNLVLNLDDNDRIQNVLSKMTPDDLANGQTSLAYYMVKNYLTDDDGNLLYKCVDTARENFAFTNPKGERVKDVHCTKLTEAMVKSNLQTIAWKKGEQLWKNDDGQVDNARMNMFGEKILEVNNIAVDNSKFSDTMSKLTA